MNYLFPIIIIFFIIFFLINFFIKINFNFDISGLFKYKNKKLIFKKTNHISNINILKADNEKNISELKNERDILLSEINTLQMDISNNNEIKKENINEITEIKNEIKNLINLLYDKFNLKYESSFF